MRDFTFNDTSRTATADIAGVRPQPDTVPENGRRDEAETAFQPFRPITDEDVSGNNTAKIAGGIVVGLLLIGGGIYAYESSSATRPQTVAMQTPTPGNMATAQPANPPAVAPPETATDTTAAPSQTSPDGISPTPSRSARPNRLEKADNSDGRTGRASAPARDATINAPMTPTPENAPPAEQSAPAGQTAMQQPLTAPAVSGQTIQPTPEVANNSASDENPPSDAGSQASTPAPAQTDQPAQQMVQPQLAQ
jgi:hypothetical protein